MHEKNDKEDINEWHTAEKETTQIGSTSKSNQSDHLCFNSS